MRIFGKKEELEVSEEEIVKEISEKKLKDLNPQNKRRRKEPPKPWGRGERTLVLGTLVVTIIASGVLALGAREWKLPGLPRLALPKVDLSLFKDETIVVGDGAGEYSKTNETKTLFKEKTELLSGVYAFYVIPLSEDLPYGVSENEIMEAASLIKLPVIAALYKEAEEGFINLNTRYSLKDSDKVGGSGSLIGRPAGSTYTYRELAEYMGQQSDNTAFNIVRRILGEEKIERAIKDLGMKDTVLETNETSTKDIAVFFEKLWKGDYISKDSADEILGFLTETIYEKHLKAGIPDTRVAHKYGREVHVVNDAGIVYSDKPFVLAILTKGVIEKEADNVFPELAKLIFDREVGE